MVPSVAPGLRLRQGACSIVIRIARGNDLRQAEVENPDAAIAGDENVIGLQIAVNDAGGMCGGKTVGDLYRGVEELARGIDGSDRRPSTNSMTR